MLLCYNKADKASNDVCSLFVFAMMDWSDIGCGLHVSRLFSLSGNVAGG